jgi:hypothetical protein
MSKKKAISAIQKHGLLLVYPINNKAEPRSLWSVFWPRDKMRWEWDNDGDDRVAELWHLREQLSHCNSVVYAKYYQGRATFFSRELFVALLSLSKSHAYKLRLGGESKKIMRLLDANSPLSTKRIKKECDLVGRFNEPTYTKALKELWGKLLIVGYGEVDDGAFPSLAIGSTQLLFEDLWKEAAEMDSREALSFVVKKLKDQPSLLKWLKKQLSISSSLEAPPKTR